MREDLVEILQKLFVDLALSKSVQNELLQLVESLYKDLLSSKNTISKLKRQVLDLLKEEMFGITSKYTALKQEHETLKQQLAAVKDENDNVNTQLIAKNEELKRAVAEKEQEMHHRYENSTKQKEDELKQKEDELQALKQSHESRIQEIYAEMEAAGAFSAMQLEQVESSYKKQLSDLNKKLKENMDTCNILRTELFNVKELCNEYKNKISELRQEFRQPLTLEASCRTQEKSWGNRTSDSVIENNVAKEKLCNNRLNNSGTPERSNISLHSKYEPLQVTYRNNLSSDDRLIVGKKPLTYRSSPKTLEDPSKNVKRSAEKKLPPLMKVNEGRNDKEKQPVKKRRLYNPEDWTYMSVDQGSESQ